MGVTVGARAALDHVAEAVASRDRVVTVATRTRSEPGRGRRVVAETEVGHVRARSAQEGVVASTAVEADPAAVEPAVDASAFPPSSVVTSYASTEVLSTEPLMDGSVRPAPPLTGW